MEHKYDIFTLDQILNNGKKLQINSSTETINELMNKLKAEAEKDNPTFLNLKESCFDLICRLPLPINIYNGFVLRARPNEPELFSHQSQISYNSERPEQIKLQRFNLDEEQVFYCAPPIDGHNENGAITTIAESFKEIFDKKGIWQHKALTIGKWIVQKPINLLVLPFYGKGLNKSFHLQNIAKPFEWFLNEFCSEEDRNKLRMFYSFFSERTGKVIDTPNNYLLTTAFYHSVREFYGEEVGILYSSSSTENRGINIVLSKKIIDSGYLKLDTIAVYEVYRHTFFRNQLFSLPTMLAFIDEGEKFELKKMTLEEIHSVTLERDVEQAKNSGLKLNVLIAGDKCCSECDKINGMKFQFKEILQKPILPYHKCSRPNFCKCFYLFEPVRNENNELIEAKY